MKNNKSKIFLIFHGRLPSEKAASLFAVKSAEAFAELGIEVVLVVPRRLGLVKQDPFDYYQVKRNFRIVYVPTIDLFSFWWAKNIAFHLSFLAYSLSSFVYLFFRAKKEDVIYSNESLPLLIDSIFFTNTFYEVHDFPERKKYFYRWLFRRVKWVLATNSWKKDSLQQKFGGLQNKIICETNAVELEQFNVDLNLAEARARVGLPLDKKIVLYTGHLYSWKGVDTLAKAAKLLSRDYLVVFVGGTKTDIERFKGLYGDVANIYLAGFRNHSEVPVWQQAADVLVLPNTAKEAISANYTSPMKLFEYMASGRPIVASKIPSIAELLNDGNSVLVHPDNPEALASAIDKLCYDVPRQKQIAQQALVDVSTHSWQARAKRILDFISSY